MTASIETWGPISTPAPHAGEVEHCPDGSCAACQVKAAGARAISEAVGGNYDDESPEVQAQLRHLASHVYSAMSEAILMVPGIKSYTAGALLPEGVVARVPQ